MIVTAKKLLIAAALVCFGTAAQAETKFKRIPVQYIASLAAPDAMSGNGAETWGLWPVDPGPRGVWLRNYEKLVASASVAPAGWSFDGADWWVEENGLIMEKPDFPLAPGKYVVTGNREASSILTVHEPDASGNKRWELANDVSIYDVTHLRCRAARYTPKPGQSCTPDKAPQGVFPMSVDREMPDVAGCNKQDYAVLIVVGVAVE